MRLVGDMCLLLMLFSRHRRERNSCTKNNKQKEDDGGVTHARDFDSIDLRTDKRTMLCFGS